MINLLEKFKKNTSLSRVIQDRTHLTHKLYYGKDFDNLLRPIIKAEPKTPEQHKVWFDNWKKQITTRAQITNTCCKTVSDVNNTIASKIINYKDCLRHK